MRLQLFGEEWGWFRLVVDSRVVCPPREVQLRLRCVRETNSRADLESFTIGPKSEHTHGVGASGTIDHEVTFMSLKDSVRAIVWSLQRMAVWAVEDQDLIGVAEAWRLEVRLFREMMFGLRRLEVQHPMSEFDGELVCWVGRVRADAGVGQVCRQS